MFMNRGEVSYQRAGQQYVLRLNIEPATFPLAGKRSDHCTAAAPLGNKTDAQNSRHLN